MPAADRRNCGNSENGDRQETKNDGHGAMDDVVHSRLTLDRANYRRRVMALCDRMVKQHNRAKEDDRDEHIPDKCGRRRVCEAAVGAWDMAMCFQILDLDNMPAPLSSPGHLR